MGITEVVLNIFSEMYIPPVATVLPIFPHLLNRTHIQQHICGDTC